MAGVVKDEREYGQHLYSFILGELEKLIFIKMAVVRKRPDWVRKE